MNSVAMYGTFTNDVLRIIWEETSLLREKGEQYTGVAFEGGKKDIWIFYTTIPTWFSGQDQKYPSSLWADMCLAMRLIGRLLHDRDLRDSLRFAEGVGFGTARWTIYIPTKEPDDFLEMFEQILHRVDEVFELLTQPLRESE